MPSVIHHPALPLNQDEAGAAENAKVRRHGVVRHLAHARDVAGVEAVGVNFQEIAKNGEPRGLAERPQPGYSIVFVHKSRHMEILD